jgi:hypothetical protein
VIHNPATTSTTTPYLWVRHATEARAQQGASDLAVLRPELEFSVQPDSTVDMYRYAVVSSPRTTTCNQCGADALVWADAGNSVKCDECGAYSAR